MNSKMVISDSFTRDVLRVDSLYEGEPPPIASITNVCFLKLPICVPDIFPQCIPFIENIHEHSEAGWNL